MLYFVKSRPERKVVTMELKDGFGRKIEYLRISVTDRCDLRCSYCMPKGYRQFEEPEHWLNFGEIARLVNIFAGCGLKRVRLTGGEPLLRKNLSELARRISDTPGIEDLSLSTNATLLASQAKDLKEAGVDRLNISLDSLDRERIRRLTGRDVLERILQGIDAAREAGFSLIKINMVAISGANDFEIEEMVKFCMERGLVLRLIETMPMGETGRSQGFLDLQPVKNRLAEKYGLVPALMPGGGPARYLRTADGAFSLGFITPISQHFCETCNRVRLSVDGSLHLCLGQEDRFDFRQLLRGGASDEEILSALHVAISKKPERHEFREAPGKLVRFMSATGG